MTSFCTTKGIQQRFSAPYGQWMNHTAERNMRTIGEMSITTMIHASLKARGWAALLACNIFINRTSESVAITSNLAYLPSLQDMKNGQARRSLDKQKAYTPSAAY